MDNLKNIDFIKDMPQVTTLNISNSAVTDISALSNSSIENLTLDKNSEIADYTSLSQMTKLNKLTIQFFSQHYSYIDVTNITQKSAIEKLEFKNANIGTGATMLFNMPNLKSLSLDTHMQIIIHMLDFYLINLYTIVY